ncbi:MAG: hypothetical protein C0391_00125 [Anaerolinea sp.]|nr:hypothetical protein [Anaerolinea sp.]
MEFPRSSRVIQLFLSLLFLILFASVQSAQATPENESGSQRQYVLPQATAGEIGTPTPVPLGFTEQELAAGRPIGIIIGAIVLVLIIFLGALLSYKLGYGKRQS